MSSIRDVIEAGRLAAILLAPAGELRFVSDEARRMLRLSPDEQVQPSALAQRLGVEIQPVIELQKKIIQFDGHRVEISYIPIPDAIDGTVIILRALDAATGYGVLLSEKVLTPLKALQQALRAAVQGKQDPLLEDTASMVERIITGLENEEFADGGPEGQDSVSEVVRKIHSRFKPLAELKGLNLQSDVPEISERVQHAEDITHVLEIYLRNSFLYVPPRGQIFIGARTVEQKGKRLALFFVMDNGATVPQSMGKEIFDDKFVWSPEASERSGRDLHECTKLAAVSGGRCWVEGKEGKSCTFFMTVKLNSSAATE